MCIALVALDVGCNKVLISLQSTRTPTPPSIPPSARTLFSRWPSHGNTAAATTLVVVHQRIHFINREIQSHLLTQCILNTHGLLLLKQLPFIHRLILSSRMFNIIMLFSQRTDKQGKKKVKVAYTRLPSVGFRSWFRFLALSLQVSWVINKPGGRLPLLSARPAVTPATLKRAATNFAAWWTEAQWVWTVCLILLPDSVAAAIWTRALLHLSPAR